MNDRPNLTLVSADVPVATATKLSTKRLRPEHIARTVWQIDTSGIVDMLIPPRAAGARGRKGMLRENTRLFLIGLSLCTRLGHETTVMGVYEVLTQTVDRQTQWDLGILRPRVTKSTKAHPKGAVASTLVPAIVEDGKPRKRVFPGGFEELSYDDLYNVTVRLRKSWDYGAGSAPGLDAGERTRRAATIADVADALIKATTIERFGSTWAIDATGQWAWFRGNTKRKHDLEAKAKGKTMEELDDLIVEGIALDDDGNTTPEDHTEVVPKQTAEAACDAAWGYKTAKEGGREVGFGFHQHTIARVPGFGQEGRSEPLLVDGFVLTPANADVVDVSLALIDRIRARHPANFRVLLGDLLYSNLTADRWAYPLAQRGIEQGLRLRTDQYKVVDIQGAQTQCGWLHCPAAPMDQRPMPQDSASPEKWEQIHQAAEKLRDHWAFDRKESGLGANLTSKWICPAVAGRVGCHARGPVNVQTAIDLGLPIITPPADYRARPCCLNKTVDFTPDLANPNHQRKIMQREYVASRRWRRVTCARSLVEGVFGIIKNPSRQRLRRGHNRLPGLAMATLVVAIKIAVFNEEQLRSWHAETGSGPADHPLLQLDQPDWGFVNLTKDQAAEVDATNMNSQRQPQSNSDAA